MRLTEWTTCGGCAAKWGGAPLSGLLREFDQSSSDELLVGLAPFDDAAVYRLSSDVALVSTTDFFPPLVDDPVDFGAVAAANACSDVFAGAAGVVAEAGGVVAGGHTIRSEEPIFGLAVQGLVSRAHILTKGGARPGDVLVLSKPLGTGIIPQGGEDAH